jgi:RimJ/RimL family protein N-acetyltransferase
LRLWRDDDVENITRLGRDARFMRFLAPDGRLATREDAVEGLRRYRSHWEERGYGLWAVEERATGSFVGRIGLSHHRLWPEDVEVGWALDPAVWGRGYATEGGGAALAHAFTKLGVDRVVSIVHPENATSIAVMGRLGIAPWRTVAWPEGDVDLEVRAIERAAWARLESSG